MGLRQDVDVIVFDTFGTVVDWRGTIIRDFSAWGKKNGFELDWADFADRWRADYDPQKGRVRRGEIPWTPLDELNRQSLIKVMTQLGLSFSEQQIHYLNGVWSRLDPWADSVEGLYRLKKDFVIGPLSNGNVAMLLRMARHSNLPWDHMFSCEIYRHYKPDPETYLGVCETMRLAPERVMMCAAHNYDLSAARKCGLKTAFILRPTEYGENQTTDLEPTEDWDVVASGITGLADALHE
jgi:2-haloacid dehalogenase